MNQAIDIRKQIGDPFYIVSDMAEMSDFYSKTGQTEKGLKTIKEAIAIAHQNKLDGKLQLLYQQQAAIYLASGDMNNYAVALSKVIEIQDSLYKHNSANAIAEMQTKYEVQKKENTIIQQELKLTKKNYFIYGTAGLLIATLFFVYVFIKNKRKTQILQLQKMEAKLKQQTIQAVMLAEEEERKRIAGDLHDSVAQKIVAAKMNLESLNHKLAAINEPEQKIFKNIHSLLEESSLEVRNLSHSMMPGAFSRSGLTDAVKDFLDKIAIPGLKIQFHASGAFEKISENRSLMIYRIIQECVQNVLKHSKASQMDVSLIAENNELDITIEDNGVGFDKEKISQTSWG
jgi:signal transduction histidine kinase